MKTVVVVADCLEEPDKVDATLRMLTEASAALHMNVRVVVMSTGELMDTDLSCLGGLLLGPGQYAFPEAAIHAAKCFRERGAPVLGTGNGFQHMAIELARSCLGLSDATHQEYAPNASASVITRLSVPLRAATAWTKILPGSKAHKLYGCEVTMERYFCRFGIDEGVLGRFARYVVGETKENGATVATVIEEPEHPYYLGTLFLPQMRMNGADIHPLISGFIKTITIN